MTVGRAMLVMAFVAVAGGPAWAQTAATPSVAPPEQMQGTTTQNNPATATTPPPAATAPVTSQPDDRLAAGANSFTEEEARGRLQDAGYREVTHLVLDRDGIWRGSATKDGRSYAVALDFKGTIAAR